MPAITAPPRIKLQNILWATDFSPSAEAVLSHAVNLARHYDAVLYTVHVLPHLPFVESTSPDPERAELFAQQKMAALANSTLLKGCKHKELIEQGEVSTAIPRLVRDHDIDLIVIGTGGRHGVAKLLLGSVAEEVFRNAACPVLTMGPHVTRWNLDGNLQSVLFATDFGAESLHALPYALSLAEEHRARLMLLHVAPEPGTVLPEPEPGMMPIMDAREVETITENHLRALLPKEIQLWQQPEYLVHFGLAAEIIVRVSQGADIVVMGVKRPTALTKHFGEGVAYRVACEASCPVLSVGARYHGSR